jgi:hypothetical protein
MKAATIYFALTIIAMSVIVASSNPAEKDHAGGTDHNSHLELEPSGKSEIFRETRGRGSRVRVRPASPYQEYSNSRRPSYDRSYDEDSYGYASVLG